MLYSSEAFSFVFTRILLEYKAKFKGYPILYVYMQVVAFFTFLFFCMLMQSSLQELLMTWLLILAIMLKWLNSP